MAYRPELETAATPRFARVLLRGAVTPGLTYRLAAWRRPAAIGSGQLVIHVHRRGAARLYYRNPDDGGGRAACVERQTWILRVPASCGASRATLREDSCIADGDAACAYAVTWTEDARLAPSVLAGILVAAVLAPMQLPPAAWLVPPAVAMATYALERWRVARATPLSTAQSGTAFRWLVGRALAGGAGSKSARAPDADIGIEQEGDMWRIAYGGTTFRLRHSRGLALLAHLVRNPNQEIHVGTLDTITPSGGSAVARMGPVPDGGVAPALGDAGEILDAQARTEYRRRIEELREALEDAEARADASRTDALRAEMELLEDELRLAVGPGGRARRAGGDAERLRVAITHRIRAAIGQIALRDPVLGAHLGATVSTGYRCVYQPPQPPAPGERAARQRGQKV